MSATDKSDTLFAIGDSMLDFDMIVTDVTDIKSPVWLQASGQSLATSFNGLIKGLLHGHLEI